MKPSKQASRRSYNKMALHSSKKQQQYSLSQQAILTTLLYGDIFHFPLTREELWQYLISKQHIPKKDFSQALTQLTKEIVTQEDSYYCLRGREDVISTRIKRKNIVASKYHIAQKIAKKLSRIPTLQFIGISGGLAAKNVSKKDDIDFFLITKKHTVFVSRLLVWIVLELFSVRRRRGVAHAPDKICVNLLIDETALSWNILDHNVYTAREIAQIVPLFQRDMSYARFLHHNIWIKSYLPNAKNAVSHTPFPSERSTFFEKAGSIVLAFMEPVCRLVQLWYMRGHTTTEIVQNNMLGFHPIDYKSKVLGQLRLKMRQFGLLTIY